MTEADWDDSFDLRRMLDAVPDAAGDRRFRLFAVACCSLYRDGLRQKRLRKALRVAERFADGGATDLDLGGAYGAVQGVPDDPVFRGGVQAGPAVQPRDEFVRSLVLAAVTRDAVGAVRGCCRFPSFGRVEEESALLRCIFGNPFRPAAFDPSWRTETAVGLARGVYDARAFDRLPILADALQDAGCDDPVVLGHCRSDSPHARGCWVVDRLLGRSEP